jgi:uncharacterized protein YjlB
VTQQERNRNLSKSLPKRFGIFDLAIESVRSQEGSQPNRFNLPVELIESALQHTLLAVQQNILLQTSWNGAYGRQLLS